MARLSLGGEARTLFIAHLRAACHPIFRRSRILVFEDAAALLP
jgi:hypothetical protein